MKHGLKLLICLILSAQYACRDEFMKDSSSTGSDRINCKVSIPTTFVTRGTPINSANDTLFTDIGILGYHTASLFNDATDAESSFFPNVIVNKTNNGQWKFSQTYFWPQTGYLSFFAYAPYASVSNGISLSSEQGNNPTLSYTVPHQVANQPDLMVATPQKNKFKEEIQLNFSHALACIGFDVSGENVPIDSIGIQGVATTATLMLDMSDNTPVWENLSGDSDLFYKVGLINNPVATNPSENLMATNGYLMMIPQTLSDNASLIVKFAGMDPKVIPLNTAGTTEWKAGSKYMYSLKEGVYQLTVTADAYTVPYTGGQYNLNITSTYTKENGIVEYPGWSAKITNDQTGESVWIDGLTELTNQQGGIDIQKILSVGLAPFKPTSAIDQYLQSQAVIDSTSMKDLSYTGGYYSSANCYVVNAPGWYKFPCWVMGNGMLSSVSSQKNSASLNADCFPSTSPLFVDYNGDSISTTADLILETTNASAELLWMDAPELITKVSLIDDGNYIQFYVGPETIRQGNAVIAIKNSTGTIMWSWQIWVNEWTIPIQDYAGFADFLGNSVGVCYPGEYNYPTRSVTIQFVQDSSNIATKITLTQDPMSIKAYLNASFYQWGRKDPMPGSNGIQGEKPIYGPAQFAVESGPVAIETAIQHPNVFYTSSGSWYNQINSQLWGKSATTYPKMLYDPSPAVMVMPSSTILTELKPTQWFPNYPGYGFNYGNQSTVIFMIFGYRAATTGQLTNITSSGYYWSNSLGSTSNEYYGLGISQSGKTDIISQTANAYTIMPVQNGPYPPKQ
ncbi:MAG: fimbrillin family protein [Bacteroidales bacterium]